MTRFGQRRYEDALALYRTLLEINPDHALTHSNVGAALLHLGRPQEALQSIERALALDPDLERRRCGVSGGVAGLLNALPYQELVYRAWSRETGKVSFVRRRLQDPIFAAYRYLARAPDVAAVWQVDRLPRSPGLLLPAPPDTLLRRLHRARRDR